MPSNATSGSSRNTIATSSSTTAAPSPFLRMTRTTGAERTTSRSFKAYLPVKASTAYGSGGNARRLQFAPSGHLRVNDGHFRATIDMCRTCLYA